jgi:hypothetical protein
MTATVIFLSGRTMGDSLGEIGRSQKNVYANLGYEFVEISFAQPDWSDALNRTLAKGEIECALSFMGMGNDLSGQTPKGQSLNLWDGMGIPFISLYGDTPAYFFDRHVMPSRRCAALYAFSEHCAFRKQLPQVNGLLGVLPPAPLDTLSRNKVDFVAKAQGKIYFLKNGNDPDKLLEMWRQAFSPTMFLMLMEVAADLAGELASERGCNIDARVTEYFRDKDLDIESLLNLRLLFVAQLDDYLRRLKSTFVARTLLDFPIEVHGYNWEHVDFSKKRARLVHGGTYANSRSLIVGALATIDMSPNTSSAPHERVSRAMGMYTLCVTNEQAFYRDRLPGFDDCLYRFERDSLHARIAEVLARPKRFVELGRDMADSYRTKFDPEGPARRILEAASCVRTSQGGRPQQLQDFFAWPPTKLL